MNDENQEGKKLSVDRWYCDYECNKCRHFCGSVSNTVPNCTNICKKCGSSMKPTKEVSKSIYIELYLCEQ